MKKKVIIILTTIMIIFAVWAVINYRQNKRYADDGKVNQPSDGESRAKAIYKIDEPYSGRAGRAGGGMYVWEGYTNNIHLDVKLEQGVVLVLFYDWVSDPEAEPRTLEDNPDKYLFRTERITKSGSYDYNMDDLPAGLYWVIINEEEAEDKDKKTVAEVDVCFSNYKKNKGD